MDFITGEIKKLYKQYLIASLASAIASSIYCFCRYHNYNL